MAREFNQGLEYSDRRRGETARTLEHRKAINSALICSCKDCNSNRNDVSIYCLMHTKHRCIYGHPILKGPTYEELTALEKVIQDWVENDYIGVSISKEGFKKIWGSALVRLRKPQSHAIPFFRLEGHSGLTQRSKGSILLAWYDHKRGKPLGAAMLRYMAVKLWADLKFTLPDGKKNLAKERNFYVNTHAGKFVNHHAGFHKIITEQNIIGWQEGVLSSYPGGTLRHVPITETIKRRKVFPPTKMASIARAVGAELKDAVEFALGPQWFTTSTLKDKAAIALNSINKKESQ